MSSAFLPRFSLTPLRPYLVGGRTLFPYALAGLMLVAIYSTNPNFSRRPGPDEGLLAGDFLQEWIGGRIIASPERERLYDLELAMELEHDRNLVGFTWDANEYLPMVYPPFWYSTLSPLASLPYGTAASVWAATMTATLAASCWVLRAWWRQGATTIDRSPQLIDWLLPATLLFPPAIECLISGQKGAICLLLLSSSFLLIQIDKRALAGMVWGLLLFKPQLALLVVVVMTWRREWRFLTGVLLTAGVLAIVSLLTSWQLCIDYLRFLGGAADYLNTSGYDLQKSHSLYGAISLICSGAGTAARLITVVSMLLLVGRLLWCDRLLGRAGGPKGGGPGRSASAECERAVQAIDFATLTLATLLISPHLLTYDLTMLVFPCLTLFRADVQTFLGPRCRPLLWTLAGLVAACCIAPSVAAHTHVQLTTILMVAVFWLATAGSATAGSATASSATASSAMARADSKFRLIARGT